MMAYLIRNERLSLTRGSLDFGEEVTQDMRQHEEAIFETTHVAVRHRHGNRDGIFQLPTLAGG